ncbi:MAG: HAD family phosphatase [Clostridiales bacterium]|nr:HAD family phosphatase [Clostridiales bacterium]
MIKNIILDVGNVLVAWKPERIFSHLGFSEEIIRAVERATVQSPIWDEVDRSLESDEELLRRVICNAPEYEKEIRLVWENIELGIWQFDYARGWIRSMKANGYHVYLLSNYGKRAYQKTANALSFLEEVDGAVFSFEVHQVKPEQEIYQTLLKKYALSPAECIFLDDREENVKAAEAQGMAGIPFSTYEDALKRLDAYGIRL